MEEAKPKAAQSLKKEIWIHTATAPMQGATARGLAEMLEQKATEGHKERDEPRKEILRQGLAGEVL